MDGDFCGRYVGCVVFWLCWWVPYLWYDGGESYVVVVRGVDRDSVRVVINGVVYVCSEAEEPMV
jgi:hypothetical protein